MFGFKGQDLVVSFASNAAVGNTFGRSDLNISFKFFNLIIHFLDCLESKYDFFSHDIDLIFKHSVITYSIIQSYFFIFKESM